MSVLSLVSWNIDGRGGHLTPRMEAVYNVLKKTTTCMPSKTQTWAELYKPLRQGELGSMKVFLLTAHLESSPENKKERKAQLDYCLQKMKEIAENNPDAVVFFGGDLNIREKEMPELPAGVMDAFLEAGAPKDERFTWDTQKNDNKFSSYAQSRFDRVLWTGPLQIVDFKLEGRERIPTVNCFPSDHWAINCTFSAP